MVLDEVYDLLIALVSSPAPGSKNCIQLLNDFFDLLSIQYRAKDHDHILVTALRRRGRRSEQKNPKTKLIKKL